MKHQSYIQTKSNHPNVNHVNCLICGKRIPSERIVGNLAICTCGWASSSRAHIFESRREWSTSLSLSMAAILLLLATLHLVQWDKFAFEVLLIKGKQIAGLIQVTDLEIKAQICEER
ncbi:MAG: hypothetical protein KDD35_12690, partial [Bdellovibrionales bacterium]|nr:hypothetical protein [Bdellovibrionales bacterium]